MGTLKRILVVKPARFADLVDAVKQIGAFWAIINEPPPNSENAP